MANEGNWGLRVSSFEGFTCMITSLLLFPFLPIRKRPSQIRRKGLPRELAVSSDLWTFRWTNHWNSSHPAFSDGMAFIASTDLWRFRWTTHWKAQASLGLDKASLGDATG